MNRFARFLVQLLQMREAQLANVELCQRRMPDRKTSNSQVILAAGAVGKKPCVFQIDQKAMHGAHRQARLLRHFARREAVQCLCEQAQQTQASLHGSDVVVALCRKSHNAPFFRSGRPLSSFLRAETLLAPIAVCYIKGGWSAARDSEHRLCQSCESEVCPFAMRNSGRERHTLSLLLN